MITNLGERTYDAAQVMFQRRYVGGLNFTTHYTLAHARQLTLAPLYNTILEWGDIPTYDIRHLWVGLVGYQLPWREGVRGVARRFLAGWQVNRVSNCSSGGSFTVGHPQ